MRSSLAGAARLDPEFPSAELTEYFGVTSELPPPPVLATAAFGPMTTTEWIFDGLERQQIAIVLEENDALGRRLARQGALLWRIDLAGCGVRLIELPADEHHAQHAADVVINGGRGYFAGRYFRKHFLRNQPAATVARRHRLRLLPASLSSARRRASPGPCRHSRYLPCCRCCPSRRLRSL